MKEKTTERPWEAIADRDDLAPIHERATVQSDAPLALVTSGISYQTRFCGKQIGNYRVEQPLGHGGFGSVFRAYDEKLGRHVAIKFLHPTIDERHHQLFEREARAIARLNKHPNIVKIFEYGEFEGQNYFVLEYVQQNAAALLLENKNGLPLKTALRIAAETADALAFAHEQGIIHRDIKPSNILLEGDGGTVKVADFGLSRFLEAGDATISGTISGTPPYMSPEQARGAPVDSRTDIFSLGVTLYEALCGERPFVGANMNEIMEKIVQDCRVPLRARRHDLPEAIYAVVDKAMAPGLADRYQTAGDFTKEVRAVLDDLDTGDAVPTVHVPDPKPARKWRRAAMTATAIAAAIAIVGLVRTIGTPASRTSSPAIAIAEGLIETGDPAGAERELRAAHAAFPSDPEIQMALGYALLLQDKVDEAERVFNDVTDQRLADEGRMAAAFARNGAGALTQIEAINRAGGTAHTHALEGRALLAKGDTGRGIEVLQRASEMAFDHEWQRTQCLQALGQALYSAGRFADAERIFRAIESRPAGGNAVASAYLARIRAQMDPARREAIAKQIASIKESVAANAGAAAAADPWTSRPLTFVVLPSAADAGGRAWDSGLAGAMPSLLGSALDGTASMNGLDRELIQDLLTELQLSSQLGTQTDQLALGKVLGARLLIRCEFMRVAQNESMQIKIVDTETSESVPVKQLRVPAAEMADAFVKSAKDTIAAAVATQYPLRAVVRRTDDACRINIGAKLGVAKAMRFAVAVSPDQNPLPGKFIVVSESVDANEAVVQPENFSPESIPADGWYVTEVNTQEAGAA